MQGDALLCAGLCQQQTALRKVEGGMRAFAGDGRSAFLPVQPARQHQMEYEKKRLLQLEDQPLAHPPNAGHAQAFDFARTRCHRPEERRALNANLLERLARNSRFECFHVDREIRVLGHVVAPGFGQPSRASWGA
jgi:hypothetical protein